MKKNDFTLIFIFYKKARSRRYPAKNIIDPDSADDLELLENILSHAESQLLSLEWAARDIRHDVNSNKTKLMCFYHDGAIS